MTGPYLPPEVQALEPYVDAGVFGVVEVHVVTSLLRSMPAGAPAEARSVAVVLALALAVRAPLHGHVRAELGDVAATVVADGADGGDGAAPGSGGTLVFDGTAPEDITDEGAGHDGDPFGLPDPTEGVVATSSATDGLAPGQSTAMVPTTLEWPDPLTWVEQLTSCPLIRNERVAEVDRRAPVVLANGALYLDRLHRDEVAVAAQLRARADARLDPSAVALETLARLFPIGSDGPDAQHRAARAALDRGLAVIAGGPGTGKTRTIARLLGAVFAGHELNPSVPLQVVLAAPTGKAAARLTDAVQSEVEHSDLPESVLEQLRSLKAITLHRLLGVRPSGTVRHDASNPLTADVVVVDEVSMVDLPMAARLLDAVRPDARLVLVGDPSQLASVEAGAVLGDIVGTRGRPTPVALVDNVVTLDRVHRFSSDSPIAALASAIDQGMADVVIDLLRSGGSGGAGSISLVDPDDRSGVDRVAQAVMARSHRLVELGRAGDAVGALAEVGDLQVLAARRRGLFGVADWNQRVERHLSDAGLLRGRWSAGRPVMVTANDKLNGLFNGDVGVVVLVPGAAGGRTRRPVVAFDTGGEPRLVDPSRLGSFERLWAMTIHKSQGSEYRDVIVTLPPPPSPILTRELLYTAVTRAKQGVTIVASEASVRAAVDWQVARSSGLVARLS